MSQRKPLFYLMAPLFSLQMSVSIITFPYFFSQFTLLHLSLLPKPLLFRMKPWEPLQAALTCCGATIPSSLFHVASESRWLCQAVVHVGVLGMLLGCELYVWLNS